VTLIGKWHGFLIAIWQASNGRNTPDSGRRSRVFRRSIGGSNCQKATSKVQFAQEKSRPKAASQIQT
jgi:hypothetical protein